MRQHYVTLSGDGSVTDQSKTIPVRYFIEVYRQVIDTSDMSGRSSAWGTTEFEAVLEIVPDGVHLDAGKTYRMQLSNGVLCDFSVLSVVDSRYCVLEITNIEGV